MTNPVTRNSKQLAAYLRDMAAAVEASDSFEGHIEYEATPEKDMFKVQAFWRVGNSEGQGGSRIVGAFGS